MKKSKKAKELVTVTETNKGSSDDTTIDSEMAVKSESMGEINSELISEVTEDEAMKENKEEEDLNKGDNGDNVEEQIDESELKVEEDRMEPEEKSDGSNNDSDDEALPEIFDGGPDSDDE